MTTAVAPMAVVATTGIVEIAWIGVLTVSVIRGVIKVTGIETPAIEAAAAVEAPASMESATAMSTTTAAAVSLGQAGEAERAEEGEDEKSLFHFNTFVGCS
jgi:hypothetical protein